jgi:hypothetical protein
MKTKNLKKGKERNKNGNKKNILRPDAPWARWPEGLYFFSRSSFLKPNRSLKNSLLTERIKKAH